MGNSFSSMRDTLANILGAEWIWLERWQGRSPRALPEAETFPTGAVAGIEMGGVEHDQMLFYRGTHATAPRRRAELHQPEGPTLFLSALPPAGPRSQPFELPSGPGNHSAAPTRRRNREHGFPRVFRREAKISTVKLSGISTQMNVVPGSTTNFCGSFGLPTRCRYFAAIA